MLFKVWSLLFLGGYSLKLLEERIKQDGVVLPGNVLKINQFLNHQIDPQLMYEIGQEFERLFKGEAVTKILTVEASGIAPAIMAGGGRIRGIYYSHQSKQTDKGFGAL